MPASTWVSRAAMPRSWWTQTLLGSVQYAMQSGLHPAQLRNQVTSPGGTTAAALHEMEKGGLRTVLSEGVWAAYRRSQALGAK